MAVEVRGLVKRFGDRVTAVDGLDLSVRPGEIYGLLGPNGAGKTTTLRMLLGLVRPTAGLIRVLGVPPGTGGRAGPGRWGRSRSTRSCPGGITCGPRPGGALPDARVEEVLHAAGLAARAGDRVRLQLGMRQRLGWPWPC